VIRSSRRFNRTDSSDTLYLRTLQTFPEPIDLLFPLAHFAPSLSDDLRFKPLSQEIVADGREEVGKDCQLYTIVPLSVRSPARNVVELTLPEWIVHSSDRDDHVTLQADADLLVRVDVLGCDGQCERSTVMFAPSTSSPDSTPTCAPSGHISTFAGLTTKSLMAASWVAGRTCE
jgi:hypothetical protein